MTSIVFPDLPIEAFYYPQQSNDMDLGEWTMAKHQNERLLDTVETSAGWVVWPPILSSACNSTWLATRKAKVEDKEKRDDSLSKWLVQSTPEDNNNKIDYVAAIREGFEKSMDAFANCLRESIKVDVESEDKPNQRLNPWLVSSPSSTSMATDRVDQHVTPWLVSLDSTKTGEKEDEHLNPWLVSATSSSPSSVSATSSSPSSLGQTIVEGVNKFLVELNLENNSTSPAITSSSFEDQSGLWLSMSDSGRAESVISEAMSSMKMDTEEDASKAVLSAWLAAETQDVYTFDGVESEASIEIIDPTFDFETMDEI